MVGRIWTGGVRRWFLILVVVTSSACEPVENPHGDPQVESHFFPIVNGQTEYGWNGVGALTATYSGYGYLGSFCTGTLVAPQWVLTAAHCLSPNDQFTPTPQSTQFFVGTDARPTWNGSAPSNGTFYQVDKFFIHPAYSPVLVSNDVGLMRLKNPVTNVPVYPMNAKAFDASFLNRDAFYVGFGVTSGKYQSGGGLKRSTSVPIQSYADIMYTSATVNTGTCFGDSGGPGFLEMNGEWKVIGIISTGWGGVFDPCIGPSGNVRVDRYYPWIMGIIDPSALNCTTTPDLCLCQEACDASGACDDAQCATSTCLQGFNCILGCSAADKDCPDRCVATTLNEERVRLEEVVACIRSSCGDPRDTEALNCGKSVCAFEMLGCSPPPPGPGTCADLQNCLEACPNNDNACRTACYAEGSLAARTQWDSLRYCWASHCPGFPGNESGLACGWEHCAAAMQQCLPPADCSPLGGDCPPETACAPDSLGRFDCFPSAGQSVGQPCSPLATLPLPCADGLQCGQLLGDFVCLPVCHQDADCGSGGTCFQPLWEPIDNVGICIYGDADGDGFNGLKDCDDMDPGVHPDAAEACGDGVDNNCDGHIEEGCAVPDPDADAVDNPEDEPAHPRASSSSCSVGAQGHPGVLWLLIFLAGLLYSSFSHSLARRSARRAQSSATLGNVSVVE
jgi:hypothetical protein